MKKNKKNHENYNLYNEKQFDLVEAMKTLRTNLEYSSVSNRNRCIVITSAVPGEGKTNVTANLGVSLTQIGYKVLLIDCDLRAPSLHKFFRITHMTGVTSILVKKMNIQDVEVNVTSANKNLFLIPSGPVPPNPIEMLSSNEMKKIIEETKKNYDYILIDAPPVGIMSDAAVLAPNVDGVIIVIKYASTPVEIIQEAVKNLKSVGANIIGTVITQIETRKLGGHYYKSKYKYYKEYEPSTENISKNKGYKYYTKRYTNGLFSKDK
ncbi:MAG: CpsD/CapB family tyrosine-protein kinase [Nanoarchaeota archaeon]|nr:CpsD/CapB family tyrosine-protein kinase [Nanoarchaeota archaeon]